VCLLCCATFLVNKDVYKSIEVQNSTCSVAYNTVGVCIWATVCTRNSSGDEIANVIFYDDIVHEFAEITQNKGHYSVQGHPRSPIFVSIEYHIRLPISD